jgi:hypothetical protein
MQYGCTLATVFRQVNDAKSMIFFCHSLQTFSRAISAAVNHYPYRIPVLPCIKHRLVNLNSGVVTGDKYKVRS